MTTLPLNQLLTHSRMVCAKTCLRKHYFRYELGVRRETDAKALRMGGAFHKGAELIARGMGLHDAAALAVASYDALPAWATTPEKEHEWFVERETVITMLSGWHWRWSGEANQIARIIAAEIPFELPLRNPETGAKTSSFRLAGKIDGIVVLKDGRMAVHEIKTTSEDLASDSDYWQRLKIDQQISTYVLAARAMEYPIDTVLYDVARKPDISPKQIPILDADGLKIVLDAAGNRCLKENIKKNGEPGAGHGEPYQAGNAEKGWVLQTRTETPEEFGDRFLKDIEAHPDHYFARREIPRLEADIEEFEHELWQQQLALRESQRTGRWFRNTAACVGFGKCEYFGVCTQGLTVTREQPPEGFVAVADLHPELKETA